MVNCNVCVCVGFVEVQSTLYRGTRISASRAFLHPFIGRENLDVGVKAHVTKVNLALVSSYIPHSHMQVHDNIVCFSRHSVIVCCCCTIVCVSVCDFENNKCST